MHILEGIDETNDEEDLPPKEDRLNIEISQYEGEQPKSELPIKWWGKIKLDIHSFLSSQEDILLYLLHQCLVNGCLALLVILPQKKGRVCYQTL